MWRVCQDRANEASCEASSAGMSSQSRQLAARRACLKAAKYFSDEALHPGLGMRSTCRSQNVAIAGSDELQSIQEMCSATPGRSEHRSEA